MIIPRFKQLHDKVLLLSVTIEDNTKSIAILEGAIKENVESFGLKYTETNAKYRVLFDENAKNYEVKLSQLLGSCSILVNEKEQLTTMINKLIEDKKEEDNKTDLALTNICTETQNEIGLRLQLWKKGEKERRERWMAENVKRVRRDTVKALEPEIKNLIHKNKVEVGNIEAEFETKKTYLEKEQEITLQLKIREYLKTAGEKREYKIDERKDFWEQQLAEFNRINFRELDNTKKDYLNLEEGEKSCEDSKIQTLIEEYDRDIRSMRERRVQEIGNMRNDHAERKKALLQDHKDKVVQLSKEDTDKKTEWEKEAKVSIRKEKVEGMITIKEDILQNRNKNIDDLIRIYNQKETNFRLYCEEHMKISKKDLEDAHNDDVTSNQEDIISLRDKLSQSYDKIDTLKIENQKIEDKIEAAEERVKHIEPQIFAEKDCHSELEENMSVDIKNINITKRNSVVVNLSKQQIISDDIKKLEEEIRSCERFVHLCKFLSRVDLIHPNHCRICCSLKAISNWTIYNDHTRKI